MSRISYVNGSYLPHHEACTHIDDRGLQFSDGVYEVATVLNGTIIDNEAHAMRLQRSLDAIEITTPYSLAILNIIFTELMRRNRCNTGFFYIQITRGIAKRNHAFPVAITRPTLVITFTPATLNNIVSAKKAITHPDIRWGRRDIKSISLLPNILAKQEAVKQGAIEALLIDDTTLTEGSSSNVFIIKENQLITHPANERILNGITRMGVIEVARKAGLNVQERAITLKQVYSSDECFITSTTKRICPITSIDDTTIADGTIGSITTQLISLYEQAIMEQCQ